MSSVTGDGRGDVGRLKRAWCLCSMRLLLASDAYATFNPDALAAVDFRHVIPKVNVPSPAEVAANDLTIVLGGLATGDSAIQLAGALRQALTQGRTVVVAYKVKLQGVTLDMVKRIVEINVLSQFSASVPVTEHHPAFANYFRAYGTCATRFGHATEAEVLGSITGDVPCAFAFPVGQGALYVLPWHAADLSVSHSALLEALLDAVTTHRSSQEGLLPEHLVDLRLHGEQDLLDEIEALRAELASRQERAAELERYRHMVGTLHDSGLEALVIRALNRLLEGTGYRAEDREDVGGEDFWIVDEDGDRAIAEVKGVNRGIGRPDVNQVDNHRAALERETEDLPGLLIVNTHRRSDDLVQRREPPHPDVVLKARQQNVLLLRGTDLYELVSRTLAGEPVGERFIEALFAGGGWLEATEERVELHQ